MSRIKFRWRGSSIAGLLLTGALLGQAFAGADDTSAEKNPPADLVPKLATPVEFAFDTIPLREFVKRLAAGHGLEIRIDEPLLLQAGLVPDLLHITARLPKITLRSALSETLRKYGLRYRIDGNRLVVEPAPEIPDEAMWRDIERFDEETKEFFAAQVAGRQRAFEVEQARQRAVAEERQLELAALRVRESQVSRLRVEIARLRKLREARLGGRRDLWPAPAADPNVPEIDDPRIRQMAEELVGGPSSASVFDLWVFANQDEVQVQGSRPDLEARLKSHINQLNRRYSFTEEQKRKLELAGRGDIHQLFDRIEDLRRQFAGPRDANTEAILLFEKGLRLRSLLDYGPFGEGSLFARILGSTLQPEQAAAYFDPNGLDKKLAATVDFAYSAIPLRDFLKRVAAQHRIWIHPDEEAIRKAGIPLDVPITARLTHVSLQSALSTTLRKYGLTPRIDGDVLRIEPAPAPDDGK